MEKKINFIYSCLLAAYEANTSVLYVASKASLSAYLRVMENNLVKYVVLMLGLFLKVFYGGKNVIGRFQNYKKEKYKKFEKSSPQNKMLRIQENIKIFKFISSQKLNFFFSLMIYFDQGHSIKIQQIYK